jgi:hypothetical protein
MPDFNNLIIYFYNFILKIAELLLPVVFFLEAQREAYASFIINCYWFKFSKY